MTGSSASCCRTVIVSIILGSVALQIFYFTKFTKPDVRFIQQSLYTKYPAQVTNVIIVSSTPRSGSSFTGEMISSANYASYFFEPLWYFIDAKIEPTQYMKESLLKNLLRCNIRDTTVKNILFSNKRSSFVFRKPSLTDIKRFSLLSRVGVHLSYIHKMEAKCRRTRLRVIKTFRMTVQEVADFIETLPAKGSSLTRQNTHLIYLVRDPRGVINSIQNRDSEWPAKFKNPDYVCTRILNESTILKENLPYLTTVRYEDIASSPWFTLVQIFGAMNQSVPRESRYFVQKHSAIRIPPNGADKTIQTHQFGLPPKSKSGPKETKLLKYVAEGKMFNKDDQSSHSSRAKYQELEDKANKDRSKRSIGTKGVSSLKKSTSKSGPDKDGRDNYFSTYRDKNTFSPNHWRTQLSIEKLKEINSNSNCQDVFKIHNYPAD